MQLSITRKIELTSSKVIANVYGPMSKGLNPANNSSLRQGTAEYCSGAGINGAQVLEHHLEFTPVNNIHY